MSVNLRALTVLVGWALMCWLALVTASSAQLLAPQFNYDKYRRLQEQVGRWMTVRDCAALESFANAHLGGANEEAAAALYFAQWALAPPIMMPGSPPCRYSDRRKALRALVNQYEQANAIRHEERPDLSAWVSGMFLSQALGPTWNEQLADAGVIGAMQDLSGLHLLCVLRDNATAGQFWDWMLFDHPGNKPDRNWEQTLREFARSPLYCQALSRPASLLQACIWNAAEMLHATDTHPATRSRSLRHIESTAKMYPRWNDMLEELYDAANEANVSSHRNPRFDLMEQKHVRQLIRKGCEVALPAKLGEIDASARAAVTTSVDKLIDAFQ